MRPLRPLRLTLVIPTLGQGGAERVLCWLANALAKAGHSVSLLHVGPDGAAPAYALDPRVRVEGLDLLGASGSPPAALAANARRLRRLRRALRAAAPEWVVSFTVAANVLTLLASLGLGLPVVVAERSDPARPDLGWPWRALRRLAYPLARRVVVQTEDSRAFFPASLARRIFVIPNPVFAVRTPPEAPPEAALLKRPALLGLGRLAPVKDFAALVRAFAALAPLFPEWTLAILGEGEERPRLEALVRELGLTERVFLPGAVADPGPWRRAADLFVLPSRYEGFPNALAEAMAAGLPVLATATAGARALIRHGLDGWLVQQGDLPGLTRALAALMADPDLRGRLGAAAPAVAARFAPERVLGLWEDLLILGDRTGGTGARGAARTAPTKVSPGAASFSGAAGAAGATATTNPPAAPGPLAPPNAASSSRPPAPSAAPIRTGVASLIARPRPRRVLFCVPSLEAGGSERVMTLLLTHLDRSRVTPSLALVKRAGPFVRDVPPDVPLHDLRASRARYAALPLARLIRAQKPDLVFSTLGHLNLLLMALQGLLPSKTKLIARESCMVGAALARMPHPRLFALLYRALYPRFDRVVCQSEAMRLDLIRLGVDPARLAVIPNPVDASRIRTLAALPLEGPGLPEMPGAPGKKLVAVGRLGPEKGFDKLLSALALTPPDFGLTIVGDGPLREALTLQALGLGISQRVLFSGFQDNPFAYMARASLLVLSSTDEGLPNAAIESLICGTPVVAFDCPGGIAEIVRQGENGWLVPPGDVAALALTVTDRARNILDRAALSKAAEKRFGLAAIIPRYQALLETV